MENLPVEIVGDILSRIADARPVVLASATCRRWRRAFRDHLRVLSFRSEDWHGSRRLPESEVETLMSRTISQTASLQYLIIENHWRKFSNSAVMRWLWHTRKSLRVFRFVVYNTDLPLNAVKVCRRCEKLEELTLAHGVIGRANPDYHRFTSLKSLSLKCCFLSEPELSDLLSVCPNLESLELFDRYQEQYLEHVKVVAPPNIRRICFDTSHLDELIHMSGSAENLETIDIIDTFTPHSKLNRFISESSKLQTLSLWNVIDVDGVEPTDLEFIATSCPQLSHLSVGCELRGADDMWEEDERFFPYCLGGSSCFENVIYLKVGWSNSLEDKFLDVFFDLVEGLLERCPSLKKLVFDGISRRLEKQKDLQVIARFTTRFFQILRKCIDSNVQFDFDK